VKPTSKTSSFSWRTLWAHKVQTQRRSPISQQSHPVKTLIPMGYHDRLRNLKNLGSWKENTPLFPRSLKWSNRVTPGFSTSGQPRRISGSHLNRWKSEISPFKRIWSMRVMAIIKYFVTHGDVLTALTNRILQVDRLPRKIMGLTFLLGLNSILNYYRFKGD